MENKKRNVLVVDDHPMNTDAYINLIKSNKQGSSFIFKKASDCETSFKIINQAEKLGDSFHVALIDINIPDYKKEKLFSGTDVALLIRNKFPNCIIIILTMHKEPLILLNVFKLINPEGFISKNEIDFEVFPNIFNQILAFENFYSSSINNSIQFLLRNTIKWDEFDTQIVLLLEKGIKTKNIPNYINLSLSSIEKRKAHIKSQILDKKGSDKELIRRCKMLNLI